MSAWTIAEEEAYIVNTLKRYDPKIESLIERCHHARLHETVSQQTADNAHGRELLLAQGPLFVVKRHGRSMYNLMLLNRKASTDPSKETLNVWIGAVPLGVAAKLEMNGSQLFINCARSGRDYRLVFTEKDDVERMGQFCTSCKSSSIGDLRSLLSFSEGSSNLSRSLDQSSDALKGAQFSMEWSWLHDTTTGWKVPSLLSGESKSSTIATPSASTSAPSTAPLPTTLTPAPFTKDAPLSAATKQKHSRKSESSASTGGRYQKKESKAN